MQFVKKHWYLLLVALFTIGLGVMVYLTSQQLATTSQVAPTAPQAKPKAAEPASCELAFNITGTTPTTTVPTTPTTTVPPTPTTTPVPPTATPTPVPPTATPTPGQQIVYVNPTPTPITQIVTVASCNSSCSVNADCAGGLVCIDSACRNAACSTDTSCACGVTPTPQPTPKTPVSGGPTVLGASVIGIGALILILGLAL